MKPKVWIAVGEKFLDFAVLLFGSAGMLAWPAAWVFLVLFFGGVLVITRARPRRSGFARRADEAANPEEPAALGQDHHGELLRALRRMADPDGSRRRKVPLVRHAGWAAMARRRRYPHFYVDLVPDLPGKSLPRGCRKNPDRTRPQGRDKGPLWPCPASVLCGEFAPPSLDRSHAEIVVWPGGGDSARGRTDPPHGFGRPRLHRRLDGYAEYAQRVHYHLVPWLVVKRESARSRAVPMAIPVAA
jgi:hypothetical protein